MPKYFGTDGFRGEASVNLTAEHAFKIGRFLGWYYSKTRGEKSRIIIGKDTRYSGDMLEASLTAGLTSSGADVFLLGITTTPGVSYVTRTRDFDCGIMISASHNPFYDNGIKLINGDGEKMQESLIEEIESYIDGEHAEIAYAKKGDVGRINFYEEGNKYYKDHLIKAANCRYDGKKIALDCANGSAYKLAEEVFTALGAEVIVTSNTPDGLNINKGCGSTHIEKICDFTDDNGCDIGFAFDGDADRCMASDEKGGFISGDHIMYICGCRMKAKDELKNNTVVTTVMSNIGLYKAFKKAGIRFEKTDVGDKYVYENMKTNGHVLGGEQSGHIIFMNHANTGDGILTAINMMDALCETGKTASELASPVTVYPQVLKNVKVIDKDETLNDERIKACAQRVAEELGDEGRLLLRKSGTEPVLRVMVEAPTEELCHKYTDCVIDEMRNLGYLIEGK